MSENFDEKVRKLVNENLRHDPEKPDWAWRHVHTKNADKDPVWGISKEGLSEEVENENDDKQAD